MIYKLDLEGNRIASYDSVAEAVNDTEGSPAALKTNIYACLRGSRPTAGGFRWATDDPLDRVAAGPQEPQDQADPEEGLIQEFTVDGPGARCTGKIVGAEVNDLGEILRMCQVDLDKWEVKRHTIKTWPTTLKRRFTIDAVTGKRWQDGVPVQKPIYEHEVVQKMNTGFTIDLVLRGDYRDRLVEAVTAHIEPVILPWPERTSAFKRTKVVELAIFDHHLGKHGFDIETLRMNWSIDEAMAQYHKVVMHVLSQVNPDEVAMFVLPTGNDLIHVDSGYGTTTSGTRVGDDQLWLQLFRYAKEAVVQAVHTLSRYAPVRVECIPGNHDQTGILALSEVVRAVFDAEPAVMVNCDPRGRSWLNFGRNLLGWHHGDRCDPRKAHTMMISDVPDRIEKNQYRAMHVGHTHRSVRTETVTLDTQVEEFGLDFEICPSLTPTDAWHDKNLYIGNLRRSKSFVYDYDKGLVATHFYNLGR